MRRGIRSNAIVGLFLVAGSLLAGCGGRSWSSSLLPRDAASGARHVRALADTAYANEVLADNPLAYYHLNDTAATLADASANHLNGVNGSAVTHPASLLPGGSDAAAAFPGGPYNGARIAWAAQNPLLQPSAISIEAWVKENATSNGIVVELVSYGQSSVQPWSLRITAANTLGGHFAGANGVVNVNGTTVLAVGTVYHAVATYDGTTASISVNGQREATAPGTGNLSYAGVAYGLGIGAAQSSVRAVLNGTLDEAAVYGTALSPGRIAAHYATGASVPPQTGDPYAAAVLSDAPVAYYRLADAPGTSLGDATANRLNGIYGGAVTQHAVTLISNASDFSARFPGTPAGPASIAQVPPNAILQPAGSLTVETWIRESPAAPTGPVDVVSYGDQSAGAPYGLRITANNHAAFAVLTAAGKISVAGATALSPLTTYHLAGTYDGSAIRVYVNGVLDASAAATGAPDYSRTGGYGLGIGGGFNSARSSFLGKLDETAIYPVAVPAARIAAHYAAGVSGTPPPAGYASTVLADSPLVYYRMNETAGTAAADSSGHGYTGTYGTGIALGGGGVVPGDAAPSFPGGTASAAKVLRSPANAALAAGASGAMSVEFWVDVPATVTGTQYLWSQSFQASTSLPAYVALNGGSSPFFTVQLNVASGTLAAYPAPVLGAKNHVVLTWNGTALTAYVNGVASDGGSGTGPLVNFSSPYTGFTVGGPTDAHAGFKGALGEFALYTTALSAAQVAAHYSAGSGSAPPSPPPTTPPSPQPGSRTLLWSVGDRWGRPPSVNGEGADSPVFSGSPATCVPEDTIEQCVGGTGAVSFHVERPDITTFPAHEYRNMMVPKYWDPVTSYAFDIILAIGVTYDIQFQTIDQLKDDAPGISTILWQNHPSDGEVLTAFGMANPGGTKNMYYFDAGRQPDGSDGPRWLMDATQGAVDTWEIQFLNTNDATRGWLDFYRNGALVGHYNGALVPNTTDDRISFGVYYHHWGNDLMSQLTSADMTFNYFNLSTIAGPIAPAAPQSMRTRAGVRSRR